MLAIEVELLTGRYVATAYNDREKAEWPPHPARFFSALVATWAEGGEREEEAAALKWLESREPPRVLASHAYTRSSAPVFVPVNDIQTVAEPTKARVSLEQAEQALEEARASGEAKALQKAEKALEKARKKLREETAKQIAATTKESTEDLKRARTVLPERRLRQPRTFPSVTPVEPRFVFVWDGDPPEPVREALSALCERLVRIGHSSSLVRAGLVEPPDGEMLLPDPDGPEILRVPGPGQLARLVEAYGRHRETEPRVLPARFVRYRRGAASDQTKQTPVSAFGSTWSVYARVGGARFPSLATVDLAKAFRGGLLSHAEEPIPSFLSGHEDDGSPTAVPHVAVVPLPFVGSEYADGQVLGIAVVPPRHATLEEERALARALGRWEEAARKELDDPEGENPPIKLWLGKAGELVLERVAFGRAEKATLREQTWSRPSRRWATATPIALDKHPGDLHDEAPGRRARAFAEAEESVRKACERIGLPRPVELDVVRSAVLPGTEKPIRFPRFPREAGKPRRVLVHARLLFAEPVAGPILLGAGRFFGLGLCRPVDDAATQRASLGGDR